MFGFFFLALLRVSPLKDYPLSSLFLKFWFIASNFISVRVCTTILIYVYPYISTQDILI